VTEVSSEPSELHVRRHAGQVAGLPAYASLADVPGPVELAVIAVAAPAVLDVARDCAAQDVRALVVLSAGFGETGPDGRARQEELLRLCRDGGMRLVGPNCLGVLNTDPGVRLDATFAPGTSPAGRIAFASQSGAYGIAALGLAAHQDNPHHGSPREHRAVPRTQATEFPDGVHGARGRAARDPPARRMVRRDVQRRRRRSSRGRQARTQCRSRLTRSRPG